MIIKVVSYDQVQHDIVGRLPDGREERFDPFVSSHCEYLAGSEGAQRLVGKAFEVGQIRYVCGAYLVDHWAEIPTIKEKQ